MLKCFFEMVLWVMYVWYVRMCGGWSVRAYVGDVVYIVWLLLTCPSVGDTVVDSCVYGLLVLFLMLLWATAIAYACLMHYFAVRNLRLGFWGYVKSARIIGDQSSVWCVRQSVRADGHQWASLYLMLRVVSNDWRTIACIIIGIVVLLQWVSRPSGNLTNILF